MSLIQAKAAIIDRRFHFYNPSRVNRHVVMTSLRQGNMWRMSPSICSSVRGNYTAKIWMFFLSVKFFYDVAYLIFGFVNRVSLRVNRPSAKEYLFALSFIHPRLCPRALLFADTRRRVCALRSIAPPP